MPLIVDHQRVSARPRLGLREGPNEPSDTAPIGSEEAAAAVQRVKNGQYDAHWQTVHRKKKRKVKT